mmetsp:Transcript_26186/g.52514  ORF Transcript_26186/g.52514 Transcript_26186/m.52514 type:complete len:215 (-) Transcript_26186:6-650(-)
MALDSPRGLLHWNLHIGDLTARSEKFPDVLLFGIVRQVPGEDLLASFRFLSRRSVPVLALASVRFLHLDPSPHHFAPVQKQRSGHRLGLLERQERVPCRPAVLVRAHVHRSDVTANFEHLTHIHLCRLERKPSQKQTLVATDCLSHADGGHFSRANKICLGKVTSSNPRGMCEFWCMKKRSKWSERLKRRERERQQRNCAQNGIREPHCLHVER